MKHTGARNRNLETFNTSSRQSPSSKYLSSSWVMGKGENRIFACILFYLYFLGVGRGAFATWTTYIVQKSTSYFLPLFFNRRFPSSFEFHVHLSTPPSAASIMRINWFCLRMIENWRSGDIYNSRRSSPGALLEMVFNDPFAQRLSYSLWQSIPALVFPSEGPVERDKKICNFIVTKTVRSIHIQKGRVKISHCL